MRPRAYLAELIGTFLLAFVVRLSLVTAFPLATPVLAGVTLMLIVFMIAPISGAHVNPAVTLGLLSIRKISVQDAALYIVAQLIGAAIALVLAPVFVSAPLAINSSSLPIIFLAEMAGAAIFLFGISAVVWKKAPESMSGVTIGGSLLLGILVASTAGNGILNPAVALTLSSFTWAYILGPIVGAVAGVWLFRAVAGK